MTASWLSIVVVNSAERPTTFAPVSDVRPGLLHSLDELAGGHVHPQIVHLEARRAEHRRHQALADLVDIPLDGADDDGAEHLALLLPRYQRWLEHPHRGLHRLGGHHQVGDEILATLVPVTDDLHAGVQRFLDGGQRRHTCLQRLRRQFPRLIGLAEDDDFSQLFQDFAHFGSLWLDVDF
jgi:hypothetical protein